MRHIPKLYNSHDLAFYVIACNFVLQNKCSKYWPDEANPVLEFPTENGKITAKILTEEPTHDGLVRTFEVERDGEVSIILARVQFSRVTNFHGAKRSINLLKRHMKTFCVL